MLDEFSTELQQVFETAVQALQCEECNDESGALNGYYLAQSRMRYYLDAILQPLCEIDATNPDLAIITEACRQLEATYSWVVKCLNTASQSDNTAEEDSLGNIQDLHIRGSQLDSRHVGLGLKGCRLQTDQERLPKDVFDAAKRCLREVHGSLEDVVGLADLKQELREAVLLPMHLPHLFVGIRRPQCNIIFHGVPGTGKTMLVEKISAEANIPLLCLCPSAILSKWSGESEKMLRSVFEAAAQIAPAIVFIDEIDSLAPTRSTGDDLSSRRVLTELLIQMTNVTNKSGCLVYVMACTNRLIDLDPAVLRRFDRQIEVPVPNQEARGAFFSDTVQRPEISATLSDDEITSLAQLTEGCTGSDLAVICREAAMAPLKELMKTLQDCAATGMAERQTCSAEIRPVTHLDFTAAIHKLRPHC